VPPEWRGIPPSLVPSGGLSRLQHCLDRAAGGAECMDCFQGENCAPATTSCKTPIRALWKVLMLQCCGPAEAGLRRTAGLKQHQITLLHHYHSP
jgi:hypothetical protein